MGILADNDDESLYNAIKLFVNDYNKVFVYQDKAAKRSLMFEVEKTMNEYIVFYDWLICY